MTLAGALLATTALLGAADPRPRLVELSRGGQAVQALALTEQRIAEQPTAARAIGLDYLRADLLQRLGRRREASEAFGQALAADSPLAPWARLRLARSQEELGHPEVASGLAATLLARGAPDALERPALELLLRTLARGGDCRLLAGLPRERFSGDNRRLRDLLELQCRLRPMAPRSRAVEIRSFLAARSDDAFAWDAVSALGDEIEPPSERGLALLIGLTAFHHREFELALQLFGPPATHFPRGPFDALGREAAYAVARSLFWLDRYSEAADRFETIAARGFTPELRSDALYQRARSFELSGDSAAARESYLRSYRADPKGSWAGAALHAALRLELLAGDESAARRSLSTLAASSAHAQQLGRAALFLAVSDLVRGKSSGVAGLLGLAERTGEVSREEIFYWKGRLAELTGNPSRAVDRYLEVVARRPFHPLASAARKRMSSLSLAGTCAHRREELAQQNDARGYRLRELLAVQPAERLEPRRQGIAFLARSTTTSSWVDAEPVPVADWPLWKANAGRPDELLLGLGLAEESPSAVARHFPSSRPRLGLTGAQLLATGPTARRAIALAEASFSRLPADVPLDWVARDWLALLYPLPWADAIFGQARVHAVEPALLAAVLREESRFDPAAVSPAAARGLAQFVLPTARRLVATAGLPPIEARDLLNPLVSIPLGATYLAEIAARFPGDEIAVIAAYNAGENQAALWRRYCLSGEPEEQLAKVGFSETRAYVTRVLESRSAYRLLLSEPSSSGPTSR